MKVRFNDNGSLDINVDVFKCKYKTAEPFVNGIVNELYVPLVKQLKVSKNEFENHVKLVAETIFPKKVVEVKNDEV